MSKRFKIGQRVRSTVDLPSSAGFPAEDGIPAGSRGTVDHVFTWGGDAYGVLFDNDPYQLSEFMRPEELEAI